MCVCVHIHMHMYANSTAVIEGPAPNVLQPAVLGLLHTHNVPFFFCSSTCLGQHTRFRAIISGCLWMAMALTMAVTGGGSVRGEGKCVIGVCTYACVHEREK